MEEERRRRLERRGADFFPKNNKKTREGWHKMGEVVCRQVEGRRAPCKGAKKQHRTARGRDAVEGEGVVGHQCTTISSTKRKPGLPLAAWCQSGMERSGTACTFR